MNNNIVYIATGAPQAPYIDRSESMTQFMNRRRVSDHKHAQAQAALRTEYSRRAAAVGMTLAQYAARFNLKL